MGCGICEFTREFMWKLQRIILCWRQFNLMDVFVWPLLIGSDFASVVQAHELVIIWNLFKYAGIYLNLLNIF